MGTPEYSWQFHRKTELSGRADVLHSTLRGTQCRYAPSHDDHDNNMAPIFPWAQKKGEHKFL